jgi:hypothetical protein
MKGARPGDTAAFRVQAIASQVADGVQRGVNCERNSEQLSDTENRAVEPKSTSMHGFARVVVPVAAGSSPVAHP